jgi:hypothetical protein
MLIVVLIFGWLFISAFGYGAMWMIQKSYQAEIKRLTADNLDLRARLFVSKGQAPPGVDLKEPYFEKKEADRNKKTKEQPKPFVGPLDKLRDRWKADDRRKTDEQLIDITSMKTN